MITNALYNCPRFGLVPALVEDDEVWVENSFIEALAGRLGLSFEETAEQLDRDLAEAIEQLTNALRRDLALGRSTLERIQ